MSFCIASARTRFAQRNEVFSSSASSAWSAASWSSATRRIPCVRSARCWTSAHDRSVCAYSHPCLRHFDLPLCPFGFLQVKRRMVTCATLRESRQIARIWLVAITNKVIANKVYRWIIRGVFSFDLPPTDGLLPCLSMLQSEVFSLPFFALLFLPPWVLVLISHDLAKPKIHARSEDRIIFHRFMRALHPVCFWFPIK